MSLPTTPLNSPNTSGTEAQTLVEFLEYHRAVLRRKAEGLSDEHLRTPLAPTSMTLGGMLKHLSCVEYWWFEEVFRGLPARAPWAGVDWDADNDWDWHSAADDTAEDLLAGFDEACASARAVVTQALPGGLDQSSVGTSRHGGSFNLRWILVHMIEEYARHCGHADLIRESLDGVTGD